RCPAGSSCVIPQALPVLPPLGPPAGLVSGLTRYGFLLAAGGHLAPARAWTVPLPAGGDVARTRRLCAHAPGPTSSLVVGRRGRAPGGPRPGGGPVVAAA